MSLNVSGLIRVPSTVNQACTARKPASRASELPIVRVWREPVAGERGEPVGAVCRNRDSVGALSTTGSLLPSGDSGTQHRRTRPRRCAACVGRRDALGPGPWGRGVPVRWKSVKHGGSCPRVGAGRPCLTLFHLTG